MLAFDIETLGVNKHKDLITVCSLYDQEAGISKVLRFVDLNEDGEVCYIDEYRDVVDELIKYMNEADTLCAFNSLNFDIPFLQIQFDIPNDIVQGWVLKTFDILEVCRRGFNRTFNLNLCLALNNVGDGKIGDGMKAVRDAEKGLWSDLETYCLSDSMLTYELSTLDTINCPEGYQWRKNHQDKSHDPQKVFKIDRSKFPKLSFRFEPLVANQDDTVVATPVAV
jgi:DNA polymerase elongation subunit (family B)